MLIIKDTRITWGNRYTRKQNKQFEVSVCLDIQKEEGSDFSGTELLSLHWHKSWLNVVEIEIKPISAKDSFYSISIIHTQWFKSNSASSAKNAMRLWGSRRCLAHLDKGVEGGSSSRTVISDVKNNCSRIVVLKYFKGENHTERFLLTSHIGKLVSQYCV